MTERVSNERKNLSRLAGEFLVASRLTQRGYMVSLQWGSTIGYDILVFDKAGQNAFLEVKATASNPGRWPLQKKYAPHERGAISHKRHFVCCVDLTLTRDGPRIYVFPTSVIADGLKYAYSGSFSKSPTYRFALNAKPRGRTREAEAATLGDYIEADTYIDRYDQLGVAPLGK